VRFRQGERLRGLLVRLRRARAASKSVNAGVPLIGWARVAHSRCAVYAVPADTLLPAHGCSLRHALRAMRWKRLLRRATRRGSQDGYGELVRS
jgi:hypothetical protein